MNKIKQFLSEKSPYVFATLVFIVWLIFFPNHRASGCVVGKIVAHILGKIGLGGTYHLSSGSFLLISPAVELKMFFGPGFFAGLIIGFTKVKRIYEIYKGLIPASVLLIPAILALFHREGFLFVTFAVNCFLLFGGVYSLSGALAGWLLSRHINVLTPVK